MALNVDNIFVNVPVELGEDRIRTLLENDAVRVERIVSRSYGSPAGFWYDQPAAEWVIVLRGHAALRFAGGDAVELKTGDYITIPAHVKHRVEKTAPETVWLAIHLK